MDVKNQLPIKIVSGMEFVPMLCVKEKILHTLTAKPLIAKQIFQMFNAGIQMMEKINVIMELMLLNVQLTCVTPTQLGNTATKTGATIHLIKVNLDVPLLQRVRNVLGMQRNVRTIIAKLQEERLTSIA